MAKSTHIKTSAKASASVDTQAPKSFSYRIATLLLAAVSFVVYANTLQNGYVLDDITVTVKNSIVNKGFSGIPELLVTPRLKGFEQSVDVESYRPVPMVTHAIEYQLFGADATAGHLVNILIFVLCVIVLFRFLDRLFDRNKPAIAFVAALVFAVHPIHTEVVANIKSRDELLCFLFAFLSLNMFARYAASEKMKYLLAGGVLLLLSFLSKETVVAFLFVVPLVFFFYINESRKRTIAITIAAACAAGAFFAARAAVLGIGHTPAITFIANPLVAAPDMASRIATAFLVLGKYLLLLIVPYPLINDYSYNTIPLTGFGNLLVWVAVLAYAGLAITGIYRLVKKSKDPWAFAILFYLATLALFSNLLFLVYSEMAERFLFFASAGFCLAVALAYERWLVKSPITDLSFMKRKATLVTILPVCAILFVLTVNRNADWKDNYTLFKADYKKTPENARMYYYLANTISYKEPDGTNITTPTETDEDCIGFLNKAVAIYPEFSEAHAQMGMIFNRMKKPDSAIVHDSLAIAANPENSIASYNAGILYYSRHNYPRAIYYLRRTVELRPEFVMGNLNLARCFSDYHQYDSSIVYYKKTLELEPSLQLAQQGLTYVMQMRNSADTTRH